MRSGRGSCASARGAWSILCAHVGRGVGMGHVSMVGTAALSLVPGDSGGKFVPVLRWGWDLLHSCAQSHVVVYLGLARC